MADINPITPVATGIQPPPQMSLGDMMNIARGAQAYQQAGQVNPYLAQQAQQQTRTGQIALGVEEQKDLERKAVQTFMADKSNYTNPNGEYDPNKALAGLTSIAPLTGLAHFKDLASSFGSQEAYKTSATGTQSAQMDFANKQVLGIASALTSVINHPLIIAAEQNPNSVNPDAIAALLKNYGDERASSLGISKEKADPLIQPYLDQAKNPAGVRQFLKDKLLTTLDQGSRLSAMQPSGVAINTGAGGGVVSTNQFGPYPVGTPIPGTVYEQQLPPTTPVISATGATTLLGPPSQRNNPPVVTNLGPAQTSLLGAGGLSIAEDLTKTVADAKEAPQRIAIFQNIKKLAPDAFTGPTAERRQMVASFAQMLGMDVGKLETASTDELMKNTSLLQLAGGNTDAARALAQFANPNNKMTKEGIARVTDQLIGMDNMKVARANYLTPVQNDAAQYSQRKQDFDAISDPRLFQEMSREDVIKLRKAMSPAEQAKMDAIVKKARSMGVLK